jgi:predicted Rossmann fold flavoprotein
MRKRDKIKPKRISDLIIVGGGASGLMAAIAAARCGIRPLILERMNRVGKKILASGNGRCNLTNLHENLEHYHGTDPMFAKPVLDRFGVRNTLRFFEELGLVWKTEDNGRVFPLTDQASVVLDLLRYELRKLQVEDVCESEVVSLEGGRDAFRLELNNSHVHFTRKLILAAGGRASPSLGSNGSGYRLARMMGHAIVEPMPAIVQIRLKAQYLKRLKGVKFQGTLSILQEDGPAEKESGEILFTDYGVSGPPALKLSRRVNERLRMNKKSVVELDLMPEQTESEFRSTLDARIKILCYKELSNALLGMIHKRLIPVVLEMAMIDKAKPCRNLTHSEIDRLAAAIKSWKIEVIGTRSWLDAQVSAGGVSTAEIHPETLESRKAPGLFFAGEIMDIDGDSGGFNLQWAWASGHEAGRHAAMGTGGRDSTAPYPVPKPFKE